MTTVDQLLTRITNLTAPTIEEILSKRDARVLRSLSTTITSPKYITENQSRLLLKIFKENQAQIKIVDAEIDKVLESPSWSKVFRPIDTTKKLYIETLPDGMPVLTIEFAFSASLRKLISSLNNSLSGLVQQTNGRKYHVDLTESNIVTLVDALTSHQFDIEENLKNYHKIIKSWSLEEVKNQFLLTNITHSNFQKQITADLGINTPLTQNIINDRSMRYQFFTENPKNFGENLTEQIANRSSSRVWISKKEVLLDDIFKSLQELKRFPMLVVFDAYDQKKCVEDFKNFAKILEKNGFFNDVGIYFRLSNSETGKEFNQIIAENQYNCQLTENTKIVGVQGGKIPKFLLKSDWKPMSVISIGNHLRNSKTAVYANCCDLIIAYTDVEPIVETRFTWQ